MDGVDTMQRSFSSDFNELEVWKFEVDYSEEGTYIKYMEREDGQWVEKQSMCISGCCDELLFTTVARDFESGEVERIRG